MIEIRTHGDILEIAIANPPVNALGAAVRQGLMKAVIDAQADEAVRAIVIRGDGALFSAGADISEFGKTPVDPSLPDTVSAIEGSAKPVVAAIHGMALGGGCEVTLGCHYRIATRTAKLGLPEVTLGLLPGAGGTQRLPRIIGAAAALKMIVDGTPITADKALAMGLIDSVVDDAELMDAAIAMAREADGVRRASERSASAEPDLFDRFAADNARKLKGLDAPKACIEAVKAAVELPFAQGMAVERSLFEGLVAGGQSKALRHAFFAQRAAAKVEGLPKDIALRPVRQVGVIGAGTMGGGISMNFLSAGIAVTIVEMAQEALDRGVATIRKNYEATAAKGRMTTEQVEAAMALLNTTLDFNVLSTCDLIIEAVYENMEVKKDIFSRLDGIAKPGAILASNTSYLDVDAIAAMTQRPQDVLGLHFFSPANVMKLVEVVRGAKSAPDVVATGMDLARRIGKIPVVAGVCYGFIGNRMLIPRQENAIALLLEGATPDQVDQVHTRFGMPMGPFQMQDLAGVDIGWHRNPDIVTTIPEALCAQGRWGQKSQAGYYDYDEKRRNAPSPVVAEIVEAFRDKAGVTPRIIDDEEIVARTLYTMVNEGAKILEEEIAQRASDIDVVWLNGYGWPRYTGGPMFWADTIGLEKVVEGLNAYKDRLGPDFSLSPLLVERAAAGRKLGD
jgi:3-hydroxyacyl-CoA dehydrogenase